MTFRRVVEARRQRFILRPDRFPVIRPARPANTLKKFSKNRFFFFALALHRFVSFPRITRVPDFFDGHSKRLSLVTSTHTHTHNKWYSGHYFFGVKIWRNLVTWVCDEQMTSKQKFQLHVICIHQLIFAMAFQNIKVLEHVQNYMINSINSEYSCA